MAFLIQSLTAPPEAGSTPEENASHRRQKYLEKTTKAKPVPHHFTYGLEHHHYGFTVDGVRGLEG